MARAHDASVSALSVESAIQLAYDAGHAAALALLAAHGLRTGGGSGHHEMAFYGAAAFGDPGLANLVADSEEIRRLRHASMYDPVIASRASRSGATPSRGWQRRCPRSVERSCGSTPASPPSWRRSLDAVGGDADT